MLAHASRMALSLKHDTHLRGRATPASTAHSSWRLRAAAALPGRAHTPRAAALPAAHSSTASPASHALPASLVTALPASNHHNHHPHYTLPHLSLHAWRTCGWRWRKRQTRWHGTREPRLPPQALARCRSGGRPSRAYITWHIHSFHLPALRTRGQAPCHVLHRLFVVGLRRTCSRRALQTQNSRAAGYTTTGIRLPC